MATATETQTTRGFKVHCPKCGAEDTLRINVEDTSYLTCAGCEDEVLADELREVIASYGRLLKWLATAPEIDG